MPPAGLDDADPSIAGAEDASARLCTACGLCCDGTLFGYVPVTRDESVRLLHRLPVLPPKGKLELRVEQRCVALGPRGCGVYADRPEACARFRCALLRRLDTRDITIGEALDVLAPILELVDRLDGALPPGPALYLRRHLLPEVNERTSPELANILRSTWADLAELDRHLAREMREPGEEPGDDEDDEDDEDDA